MITDMFSKKVAEQDDTKYELSQTQKSLNEFQLKVDNFQDYHNKYQRESSHNEHLNDKVIKLTEAL